MIKAQVLAGGRGKGIFDNGFQGGVHLAERSVFVESPVCGLSAHWSMKAQGKHDTMQPRCLVLSLLPNKLVPQVASAMR